MSIESKQKKAQTIDSLQEAISKCSIGILTDYRGLATPEMTTLRRKIQETNGEYKVVKNTLARFAAKGAGMDDLASLFEGPVAIAFGHGDITAPARILANFIRDGKESISIKGGFLADRVLTAEDIMTLSTLPSREILLARVFGQMKSPISSLLGYLTTPISGFIGVVQARIKQLEGE